MGALTVTKVSRIDQAAREIEGRIGSIVKRAALDIEAEAKMRAPVDTGNLRASIGAQQVSMHEWAVHAHAHYALYVEMGTRYMRAQPFMAPAVARAREQLSSIRGLEVRVDVL